MWIIKRIKNTWKERRKPLEGWEISWSRIYFKRGRPRV